MASGTLATPGCVIKAEDNSFTIVSGHEFQPPFQIGFDKLLATRKHRARYSNQQDLMGLYDKAISFGAKRVRVTVPGRAEPLYGVLALFDISDLGTGPGSRSYRIEIPQQYIDAATGGQVSVVYEGGATFFL